MLIVISREAKKVFQTVFKRYENKYFINSKQYAEVLHTLERYTKPDRYGRSRICSVYYDTPDRRLIRASLEKPVYKEKLRLRTYGVPSDSSLHLPRRLLEKADESSLYNSFVRQPIRKTKTERIFPLRLRVSKKQALIEKSHT